MLAREEDVASKLGHRYRKASGLADSPPVPRVAYVSTEAFGDSQGAVIGTLMYVGAGLLMGPVAAAGGIAGTWLAKFLGDQRPKRIQEQLDRGGLLLWVRTGDPVHKLAEVSKPSG